MQILRLFELLYPFFYLFFVCAFFGLARIRPELKSAYWFAAGYTLASIGFLTNFANGYLPGVLISMSAVFLYSLATAATCFGLIARTNKPIVWRLYGPITLISIICVTLSIYIIPNVETNKTMNDAFTGIFFVGASLIALPAKGVILNRTICALYICFGTLFFLMAPILSMVFEAYNAQFLIFMFHGSWAIVGAATVLTAYVIHLFKLLKKEADADPLTGLLNRRGFADNIPTLTRALNTPGEKLYILMADLDNFKIVNDTYGHAFGDQLICKTARILKKETPFQQIAARMGGEEFALAFTASSLVQAKTLAEHIRKTLANTKPETGTGEASFTISIGIAEGNPNEELATMLDRADEALYLAKRSGRNCVKTQQDVALTNAQDMSAKAQDERENTDSFQSYNSAS